MKSDKIIYVLGGVILLVIILFGGYKVWHHFASKPVMQNNTIIPTNSGLPNKTDGNDQQLNQDLQDIQNSMNQLQQNQNDASQAVNNQSQDTPVATP